MSKTITLSCSKCHNTGVMNVWNGPDDVDQEYCACPFGEQKEMLDDDQQADAVECIKEGRFQKCNSRGHDIDCPLFLDYSGATPGPR